MGQHYAGCCGSKCSQSSVVTIVDEFCTQKYPGTGNPGLGVSDSVPEWSPEVEAQRAAEAWAQCNDDLQRRTLQFVRRAFSGIPCWLIDAKRGCTVPASYIIDETLETFVIEVAVQCQCRQSECICPKRTSEGSVRQIAYKCQICDIRNIWVCADSELARRTHGTLKHACDADYACTMLMDTANGPVGLVERSSEAREDFLDSMAVLIATQRLRKEPEIACCRSAVGPPPPEARLRPVGKSLLSSHMSGPICIWLAKASDGILSRADTKRPSLNGKMKSYLEGKDFSPPQAPNAALKFHGTLLVDIDAQTITEGPRGPVPLLTPQWKRSNLMAATGRAIHSDPLGVGGSPPGTDLNEGRRRPRNVPKTNDASPRNGSPAVKPDPKTSDVLKGSLPGPLGCELAVPRKVREPLETDLDSTHLAD